MALVLKTNWSERASEVRILPPPPERMDLYLEKLKENVYEVFLFFIKQVRACAFAGSFLAILFLSHHITIPGLYRYDFLFLAAVLIQLILILTKLETWEEVRYIFLFHIIGLVLEIFKTNPSVGSWSYPEPGILKIATVPLYSGFMYAAVGSYISQAWKVFNLRLLNCPRLAYGLLLSVLIYLNFFTNHFIYDFRYIFAFLVVILFWKTEACYTIATEERRMPLVPSFLLIAFFIWIAENIGTYLGAWQYPEQLVTWTAVSIHKISSWSLLVIISFIVVATLKYTREDRVTEFKKQ